MSYQGDEYKAALNISKLLIVNDETPQKIIELIIFINKWG